MKELESYTKLVSEELESLSFPSEPRGLYDPLTYFIQIGGKRIRPILTLLGAELFGGQQKNAIKPALAIEVFHNFTLIHDDIMDEAPLRRGKDTVHRKWNENVAILSGDALLIRSYQLLNQIPTDRLGDALELFNRTALEVCEGQQYDLDFEDRKDVSVDEYIEMIRLKTSVLLGCALEMGAITAGASNENRAHLYNFGQHIGIAFQIQDDVLDVYGDPEKFGKQAGGDIVANKKTVLYLSALQKANATQLEVLKQLSNEKDIQMKVERTTELFNRLGVKEICNDLKNKHLNLAFQSLDEISGNEDCKLKLRQLASYLIQRDL